MAGYKGHKAPHKDSEASIIDVNDITIASKLGNTLFRDMNVWGDK